MADNLIRQIETDIKNFLAEREKIALDPNTKVSTIFNNERSFQLALTYFLKASSNYDEVFMEYYLPKELMDKKVKQVKNYPWNVENMYIDIVVRRGDEYVLIELKYITDSFTPEGNTSTKMVTNFLGSTYLPVEILRRHSAQDIRCYDFWKDVKRIEFLSETFPRVIGGFCLILTNEKSLVKGPTKKASYIDFGLKHGSLSPRSKEWKSKVKISAGRPGFTNKQNYPIDWIPLTLTYKAYALHNLQPRMKYVPKEPISDDKIQFHYYLLKIIPF